MIEDKDLEEVFDRPFDKVLNDMASRIKPQQSRKILEERGGKGRALDISILLKRGFNEAWQFIVIIQALFIFLGLSPQVSTAVNDIFGVNFSGFWVGLTAVVGIVFFFVLGMVMLLYGGSRRTNLLIGQKQNPAQMMDYWFYRLAMKKLQSIEGRLEKIEEKSE